MDLKGQTALVTGASGGIGRSICERLAAAGVNIAAHYMGDGKTAGELANHCKNAYGVCAAPIQADISDPAQCAKLVREAMGLTGRVEICVLNAGITRDGLFLNMGDDDFDSVLKVNLYGAFYCMREVARPMLRQKYGRIIAISSVVGVCGNAGQTNYAASKAGMIGMVKSAAKELARKNITVNAIAPGMIATQMTKAMGQAAQERMLSAIPMGREGSPADVAQAVAFFADPASSYVTGQVLCTDGGLAI